MIGLWPKITLNFKKAQVTIQFVRKLLEGGAEIDTLDRKDRTPIMIAAEFHPDPGHEFETRANWAGSQLDSGNQLGSGSQRDPLKLREIRPAEKLT